MSAALLLETETGSPYRPSTLQMGVPDRAIWRRAVCQFAATCSAVQPYCEASVAVDGGLLADGRTL